MRISTASRRGLTSAGVASLLIAGSAIGAAGQEAEPAYPPLSPSSATAECVGDLPYLSYRVDFGVEFANEPLTIVWENPSGEDLVYQRQLDASGRAAASDILWPGASTSPKDWPGWTSIDGVWTVDGNDEGAWTRYPEGVVNNVTFNVNPAQTLQVTYPPASMVCADPPVDNPPETTPATTGQPTTTTAAPTSASLPRTGAHTAALALVASGLVAAGTTLVVSSRRKARTEV